jgi:hypothetical protein
MWKEYKVYNEDTVIIEKQAEQAKQTKQTKHVVCYCGGLRRRISSTGTHFSQTDLRELGMVESKQ